MTPELAQALASCVVALFAWSLIFSHRPIKGGAGWTLLGIWSAVFYKMTVMVPICALIWPFFFRACRREAARRDLCRNIRECVDARTVIPADEAEHLVSSFGGWSGSAP